jgi:hypothetical protein
LSASSTDFAGTSITTPFSLNSAPDFQVGDDLGPARAGAGAPEASGR